MFELAEETQLRLRLSETLRYVVSQRLAPKVNGGRIMVNEIMGSNLRTREAIALGEAEGAAAITKSSNRDLRLVDLHVVVARYQAGLVTEEMANLYASNKAKMTRYIDDVKKQRGLDLEEESGLKFDRGAAAANSYINLKIGK